MARGDPSAIATGDGQAVKQWAKGIDREKTKDQKLARYQGGSNSIIHRRTELNKEAGDQIKFDLTPRITDSPIGAEGWGRQAESPLTFHQETVLLGEISYTHYVKGKLSEQRTVHNLFSEGRKSIAIALAEQIEKWKVNKLSGEDFKAYPYATAGTAGTLTAEGESATTNTNLIWAGNAVNAASLTDADVFKLHDINKAVRAAKNGTIDGSAIYQMRPGKGGLWVCLITPNQEYFLETQDSNWVSAMLHAETRGKGNPLFKDVDALWKNTLITTHDNLHEVAAVGDVVAYGYALFLGAQAGVLAEVTSLDVSLLQIDHFKAGIGVRACMGFDKVNYNSKDWATIALPSYNGDPT